MQLAFYDDTGKVAHCQIDAERHAELSLYTWTLINGKIATEYPLPGNKGIAVIFLARLIAQTPALCRVLYLDKDPSNCQLNNLVNEPIPLNSKLPGTSFDKLLGNWRATISINNKTTHIGNYDTRYEAYLAYLNKQIELGRITQLKRDREIQRIISLGE